MTTTHENPTSTHQIPAGHRPAPEHVRKLVDRRSYCTLATVSPAGRPHVAGVLYELVDGALFVSTLSSSRKARNIAHDPHVAVVIPVRRMPAGAPPSAIQFQTTASLLALDDPVVARHVRDGSLASITKHGELELPGSCFVRIDLPARAHTYGLGMSLVTLARDPLGASGVVDLHD